MVLFLGEIAFDCKLRDVQTQAANLCKSLLSEKIERRTNSIVSPATPSLYPHETCIFENFEMP
jgi:hypothetical protein